MWDQFEEQELCTETEVWVGCGVSDQWPVTANPTHALLYNAMHSGGLSNNGRSSEYIHLPAGSSANWLCYVLRFFDPTSSLFFLLPPAAHFCFRNWKSSPLSLVLLFSWVLLLYLIPTRQTTAIYNSDLYPQHAMHSTPPTICSTCLLYLPQLVQQKPANISITSLSSIADIRSLSLLFTCHTSLQITCNCSILT